MTGNTNINQIEYQQHITNQRYSKIFRDLIKYDKEKQIIPFEATHPLVRAALHRIIFKTKKHNNNLLSLVTKLLVKQTKIPYYWPLYGLKQALHYQETMLHGLWHFNEFNRAAEQNFNRWLIQNHSSCAICYMFVANQNEIVSQTTVYGLLFEHNKKKKTSLNDDFLQCCSCYVQVHRLCFEAICLALNVVITQQPCDKWFCQRCDLKIQVNFHLL